MEIDGKAGVQKSADVLQNKKQKKNQTNKLGSRVPNDHWRDLLFTCFHLPPLTQGLEQPKS